MNCVLSAKATVFFVLNTRRMFLLVFVAIVIALFALGAFQRDEFSYFRSHDLFSYLITSTTVPAPTVLPPSRIAKRKSLSIAMGAINSTSI
jgi:hypothetical protein